LFSLCPDWCVCTHWSQPDAFTLLYGCPNVRHVVHDRMIVKWVEPALSDAFNESAPPIFDPLPGRQPSNLAVSVQIHLLAFVPKADPGGTRVTMSLLFTQRYASIWQ
jgi:hypothetical protein